MSQRWFCSLSHLTLPDDLVAQLGEVPSARYIGKASPTLFWCTFKKFYGSGVEIIDAADDLDAPRLNAWGKNRLQILQVSPLQRSHSPE